MTVEELAESVAEWFDGQFTCEPLRACRVSVVVAALRAAVAEERAACAVICDEVQQAADNRYAGNADPGEGSDGAAKAAELIRKRA